jgi:hypothetical protein
MPLSGCNAKDIRIISLHAVLAPAIPVLVSRTSVLSAWLQIWPCGN